MADTDRAPGIRAAALLAAALAAALWARGAAAQSTIERLTASEDPSSDVAGVGKSPAQADERPRFSLRRDESLGRHSVGLAIGQTFLQGRFKKKYADGGISPGLYYNYTASHSFDLLVNLHSSTFKREADDGPATEAGVAGLAVGVKVHFFKFDSLSVFGIAGPGFYKPSVHDPDKEEDKRDSESKAVFGHHFGGGGELELNRRVSLAFIAHYHDPYDIKERAGRPKAAGRYYKLLMAGFYAF